MTSREAKRLLAAYRPGVDDSDPQFAEALALARRDPELARWLAGHEAAYSVIRGKLRTIEPPADLKGRILARPPVERPLRARWPVLGIAAAAAVIVVAISLAGYWSQSRQSGTLAAYRHKMVAFVSREYTLDTSTDSFEELNRRFVAKGYPTIGAMPPAMSALELEGGCMLQWRGRKVALICTEAPEEYDVWLFLAELPGVAGAPGRAEPRVVQIGKMATATWKQDNLVHLLVVEGDEARLRGYL